MLFKRKIFYLISYLLVFNLQCKKEKLSDDTYFNSKVMILGHSGIGVNYKMPRNTYESIAPLIGIGADGSEIDVQMTKDSVLVLYHDRTLNASTSCTGRINEYTWEEIKACKYLSVKDDIFIYKLDEVFSRIPNLQDLYFSFDSKLDDEVVDIDMYQSQYIRAVKNICAKYSMTDNVLIEGPQNYLMKVKSMGLANKLFLLTSLTQANIDTATKYSFFGLSVDINEFYIDADNAHDKGLYVMGYDPDNYYSNLDAIKKKVDILQTDDPISILKHFERYNYDYIIP